MWTCPNCKQTLEKTGWLKLRRGGVPYWEVVEAKREYKELAAGTYRGKAGR